MMAISSSSCFTRSARAPFLYISTDSWRCLIIFCRIASTSASPSGGLPEPRASMSAFLSVELTMRRVETARSFLAFIASFKALLMSSRSTGHLCFCRLPDRIAFRLVAEWAGIAQMQNAPEHVFAFLDHQGIPPPESLDFEALLGQ